MPSFTQTFFRTADEVASAYLQPRIDCPCCNLTVRYDQKYRIIQCGNCKEIFDISNVQNTLKNSKKKKKITRYDQCPTCNTVCCYIINESNYSMPMQVECCKCTFVFTPKHCHGGSLVTSPDDKQNIQSVSSREIRSTRVFHSFVVKPWPPSSKNLKPEIEIECKSESANEENDATPPARKRRRLNKSQNNCNNNNNKNTNDKENKILANKEKRRGDWRSLPSSGAPDRVTRALNERILLVSCENINDNNNDSDGNSGNCKRANKNKNKSKNKNKNKENTKTNNGNGMNDDGNVGMKFVLLSTGNQLVQTTISHIPSCTCPDYKYGKLCKHIYFVYFKILQIPMECPLFWQRALLTSEINDMLYYAPKDTRLQSLQNDLIADTIVRREYHQLIGKNAKQNKVERKNIQSQLQCPICYQNLIPSAETSDAQNIENENNLNDMICHNQSEIVWCEGMCGTNYHKECIQAWSKVSKKPHCPLCRAPWQKQTIKKGGKFYKMIQNA